MVQDIYHVGDYKVYAGGDKFTYKYVTSLKCQFQMRCCKVKQVIHGDLKKSDQKINTVNL